MNRAYHTHFPGDNRLTNRPPPMDNGTWDQARIAFDRDIKVRFRNKSITNGLEKIPTIRNSKSDEIGPGEVVGKNTGRAEEAKKLQNAFLSTFVVEDRNS